MMGERSGRRPQDGEAPKVKVIVTRDHVAVLDPPTIRLRPMLEVERQVFTPGGPRGWRRSTHAEWFWRIDLKGRLRVPAGMLPRALGLLAADKRRVEVEDQRRPGRRLGVDEEAHARLDAEGRSLVDSLAAAPQGQVEVRDAAAAIRACVAICAAFREARVAVAVATRRDARTLRHKLADALGEPVGLAMTGPCRIKLDRCVVGSYPNIPRRDAGYWDILLLPRGVELGGDAVVWMVPEMHARRIYALVEPRHRADRRVALRLEQIAGAVVHAAEASPAPPGVVMIPMPVPPASHGDSPLDTKRKLYWHHDARNRRVVEVAMAIAAGDRRAASRLGVPAAAVKMSGDHRRRVAILVESTEHGRVLLARIPGATMHATSSGTHPENPADTNAPKSVIPDIVTAAYADRHGVDADVVVRSTGGVDPLRVHAPSASGARRVAVVVDCDDRHHPRAVADTRRRVADYRRRDMRILAAPLMGGDHQTRERNPSDVADPVAPEVGGAPGLLQRQGRSSPAPSRSSGGRT